MISKKHNIFASHVLFTSIIVLLLLWFPAIVNGQTATAPAGSGTEADPYLITDINNLYWVTQNSTEWDKYYLQTADIDASSTSSWAGHGYIPIGNTSTAFTGTYDGDGHTISGIYMDAGGYRGLFGYADGAVIKNVGVINVDINATANNVGAVAASTDNNTIITNCYSTGSINTTSSIRNLGGLVGQHSRGSVIKNSNSSVNINGYRHTGGLVGSSSWGNGTAPKIENSYSTGDISGNIQLGGLVGSNFTSEVTNSYATGNVDGLDYLGGLIGDNADGDVSNSYATGDVNGRNDIGGLIGINSSGSAITNTYSTGFVSGTSRVGGLTGTSTNSTVTNSYWNTETSGNNSSSSGTGLTTSEMKQQSSFSGWDFSNTWGIEEGTFFPYLKNTTHRIGGPEISGPEDWHMYGVPFASSSYEDFTGSLWTQGFTDASTIFGSPNLLLWDEDSQQWNAPVSLNDSPAVGQGFMLNVYEDDDYDASGIQGGYPKSLVAQGSANALPLSISLSFNNGPNSNYNGFNLVSNPSASTLDWDQVSRSNASDTYYVWDPAGAHYDTYQAGAGGTNGGTNLIAPFQGFWSKANASPASITIDSSAVSNSNESPYKQPDDGPHYLLLHLENSDGLSDEVRLVVNTNSREGLDEKDAVALTPLSTRYLKIGTIADGKVLSIDSRPQSETNSFDLILHGINVSKVAELSLVEHNLPDDWALQLVHLSTGSRYDLRKEILSIELEKYSPEESNKSENPTVKAQPHKVDWQVVLYTSNNTAGYETDALPDEFALHQNYPNPFNPATVIRYQLPVSSDVQLEVFDLSGRRVATLVNGSVRAGSHEVSFDASDLSSGIYIYRLKAGNQEFTRKLTLIK